MIFYEKSKTQIWIIYNWNVFSNWRMNIYLSVFQINNFVVKQKPLEHFSGCGTRLWSLTWSNGYFHWLNPEAAFLHNGLMKGDGHRQAISDLMLLLANWPHCVRPSWRPEQFVNLGKLSTANLIEEMAEQLEVPELKSCLLNSDDFARTKSALPSGSTCKKKKKIRIISEPNKKRLVFLPEIKKRKAAFTMFQKQIFLTSSRFGALQNFLVAVFFSSAYYPKKIWQKQYWLGVFCCRYFLLHFNGICQ